jgi:hypothetical protein
VSTGELLALAQACVVPPFSALFLYGSYARGDNDGASDVDIIQVSPTHTAPYSKGRINITCYGREELISLAESGSLFARHIITEAIPLDDPEQFLSTLRTAYVAPRDYGNIVKEVIGAIPIVAIGERGFEIDSRHYCATASYLLRSYLYARAFDLGAKSFSMRHVAEVLSDERPRNRLLELKLHQGYSEFRCVVDLLFELTATPPFCREESLEVFVVNSYGSCDLAVILGLRVLARGNLLTYVFTPQKRD